MIKHLIFLTLLCSGLAFARATYTGYSGAPGRQTCAGSCHGSGGGTIQVVGFPAAYTPGQTYQITVRHSSGSSIRNFNASCRIGTGSQNAGTIAAGLNTVTYNVSGETNGIHYSTASRDSGKFSWTAPAAGTGTVRLYLAGQQGSSSGANTVFVGVSTESAGTLPGAASNPNPADNASLVVPSDSVLSWTPGEGANTHEVSFGTTNPPPSFGTTGNTTLAVPRFNLGTTYYWQVNERNASGLTTGPIWSFTCVSIPSASNPLPNDADTVHSNIVSFSWSNSLPITNSGIVFKIGTSNPPTHTTSLAANAQAFVDTLPLIDGRYYWQIEYVFPWGNVSGNVWSLVYTAPNSIRETASLAPTNLRLEEAYPNPFNPSTTIRYSIPSTTPVRLAVFDLTGREVALLASGTHEAGSYSVTWAARDCSSGIYFCRLTTDQQTLTSRLLLMK